MADIRDRVAAALGDSFELGDELGRGGMAVVYRAVDRRLRRPVAIKVLPPELAFNADVRTRFLREAQMSARLAHANIVPIYTVDERDGVVYFVMGLVRGESLASRLKRERTVAPDQVRRILVEVADALAYAHAHGVVHRDIKPDNILIDQDTGQALVTDFGIARAAEEDSRLTVTGIAVGTPAYMSPEQAMGERELDGRSDLYSLAVVGYQMLCGEPPFRAANTPAMLMKHLVEPPAPLRERAPHVPEPLANAVHKALAKQPEDRWADAAAFRDAIRDGTPVALPPAPRPRDLAAPADQWWPAAPRLPDLPPLNPRKRGSLSRHESREERRERWRELREHNVILSQGPLEPGDQAVVSEHISEFRRRFLGSAAIVGFLVFINAVTQTPPWSFFPFVGLSLGMLRRWSPLGRLGLKFWDVVLEGDDAIVLARNRRDGSRLQRLMDGFRRRLKLTVVYGLLSGALLAVGAANNADFLIPPFIAAMLGTTAYGLGTLVNMVKLRRSGVALSDLAAGAFDPNDLMLPRPRDRALPPREAAAEETVRLVGADVASSGWGATVRRAVESRAAIVEIVRGMGKEDRALIPEVLPTVESLVSRVATLAKTVYRLRSDASPEAIARLDARLQALSREPDAAQHERTRTLLERQRSSLQDLVQRADQLESQLESAAIMLETLRLDLAKLRSSGLAAAADDVSSATQEARALSRELEYALSGIREARGN